jgi:hypothetical protein
MKGISIRVISEKIEIIDNLPSFWGKIRIGDFEERFVMPLDWWNTDDYERQWQEGLQRIQVADKSCLVTYVVNPINGPFIDWWILYREQNNIIIQNQLLFGKKFEKKIAGLPFTLETCYRFIEPRDALYDKKHGIALWTLNVSDL